MFSGDQRKPKVAYDMGPETEPGLKQLYHGMGTPHSLVYTSNPISWLVSLTQCIPFLNLSSANADVPVDQNVKEELDSFIYDAGQFASDTAPGNFAEGTFALPPGDSPRSANRDAIGYTSPSGVPMGIINGKVVPLFGSRKTNPNRE